MAIDLVALKAEFDTNPVSMSYLAFTAVNDGPNTEIINNTNGGNSRTVNQEMVETADIRSSCTLDAFSGLNAAEQSWFEWLTSGGEITVNTETLQKLAGIPTDTDAIWQAGDRVAMNAAMTALMQFLGSRAQELRDTLGVSRVSGVDVRNARLL